MNFNSYHFSEGVIQQLEFENYGNMQFLAVSIRSGSFVQSMPAFRLDKEQVEGLTSHLLKLFEVDKLSDIVKQEIYMLGNDMSILAIFPKNEEIMPFTFYGYLYGNARNAFEYPVVQQNQELYDLVKLLDDYPMLKENKSLGLTDKINLTLINEAIAHIKKPNQLDMFFSHYMSQLLLAFNLENSLPRRESLFNKHKI